MGTDAKKAETAVEANAFRLTARRPRSMPVYGLWVKDGGPDGLGCWMVETFVPDCDGHPAVFYDRALAEKCCAAECLEGLDVEVVELTAK